MNFWLRYLQSEKFIGTPYVFISFLTNEIDALEKFTLKRISELEPFVHRDFVNNSIKHILLPRLANSLEIVLSLEFNAAQKAGFLKTTNPLVEFLDILTKDQDSLFVKYPVLRNTIDNLFNDFKRLMQQLLQHCNKDYQAIIELFFNTVDCQLIDAQCSGDSHENGRSVIILSWYNASQQQKFKLLYKPRSAKINLLWNQVVDFINKKTDFCLRNFKFLAKRDYCWAEYIEYRPCRHNDLPIFYQKLGGLLALTYILGGNDIHAENLIACGSDPVIIDLETMFQPLILPTNKKTNLSTPLNVLSQYFLPNRICNIDLEKSFDLSSVRNIAGQRGIVNTLKIKPVGTDGQIKLTFESQELSQLNNTPADIDPLDYQLDLVNGFEAIYRCFLGNAEKIKSCLSDLDSIKVRLLVRPTYSYTILLGMLRHPDNLLSLQAKQSFITEKLRDPSLSFQNAIIPSEKRALNDGHVPSFWFDNKNLQVADGFDSPLDLFVYRTSYQQVEYMLSQISERDLFLQKFMIHSSFDAARKTDDVFDPSRKSLKKDHAHNEKLLLDWEILYKNKAIIDKIPIFQAESNQHASFITDYINNLIVALEVLEIKGGDRIVGWPTTLFFPDNSLTIGISNIDLYDGLLGFSLVYAYLGQLLNCEAYTQKAKKCLERFWYNFTSPENLSVKQSSQGGRYGYLGGCVLVLARLSKLWSTREYDDWITLLLQKGEVYCQQTRTERLTVNDLSELDWIIGKLGYLEGIIKSQPLLPDSILIQSDIQKLFYIVSQQLPASLADYLPEYSHKLIGIMQALHLCINEANCEKIPLYSEIIDNLDHFEESLLNDSKSFANGYVLAMLRMSEQLPQLKLRVDKLLSNTLQQLDNYLQQGNPGLSHGASGLLEIILTAFQLKRLSDNEYAILIKKIIQVNNTNLHSHPQRYSTGLMSGYVGMLYQALRIQHAEVIPAILF